MLLPSMQPVPLAEVPPGIIPRIISAAGAGFPSPAQDWADDSINLVELLRLDRAASFVFRISRSSMMDAGIHDNDGVPSREARKPRLFIKMGDPLFIIREVVKRHGIQVRSNYELYADLNRRFNSVIAEFSDTVEVYSIDESFFRLSTVPGGAGDVATAHRVIAIGAYIAGEQRSPRNPRTRRKDDRGDVSGGQRLIPSAVFCWRTWLRSARRRPICSPRPIPALLTFWRLWRA